MLNVKKVEYDKRAAFLNMQREASKRGTYKLQDAYRKDNCLTRVQYEKDWIYVNEEALDWTCAVRKYASSGGCTTGCNCAYCQSKNQAAGMKLRAILDRFYHNSALENKRIHEEAEKTKRLMNLTGRKNRQLDKEG